MSKLSLVCVYKETLDVQHVWEWQHATEIPLLPLFLYLFNEDESLENMVKHNDNKHIFLLQSKEMIQ